MRRIVCGTRMVRLVSSVTPRKAGAAIGGVDACACRPPTPINAAPVARAKRFSSHARRTPCTILLQARSEVGPQQKTPCELPWGETKSRLLSRKARPAAAEEGSLADGLRRSQWRDRGRFARPSPHPMPAKIERRVNAAAARESIEASTQLGLKFLATESQKQRRRSKNDETHSSK